MNNENNELSHNDVEINVSEEKIILAPPVELFDEAKFANELEHVDTKVKIWYNKYMNITKAQYARIEKYFPVQRGNVKIDNYTFINYQRYLVYCRKWVQVEGTSREIRQME